MKQGTHAEKIKKQVLQAAILANLDKINDMIQEGANANLLEPVHNLSMSIAFAKFYDEAAKIAPKP